MSLIRISQYNKETLPRELNDKLYELVRRRNDRPFSVSAGAHYLLAFSQNNLLGFVELKFDSPVVVLRNIVVDSAYKEQNISLKLLRASLAKASKYNCHRMQLACKKHHINLFKQAGFLISETPESSENGSFYIMENSCPDYYLNVINQHSSADSSTNINDVLVVGEDSDTHNFSNENQYLQLHNRLVSQATKHIWILCDSITNPILDNMYTSQSLLRLVKKNPQAEIRLLLANDKVGAGYFNPTVNLAQRLTSYVEVRTINKNGAPFREMLTLVDFKACLYRKSVSSMMGFANFNNPLMAQRLKHNFEHHWAFSKPSLQLRRLAI